jgi:hypothetical protein
VPASYEQREREGQQARNRAMMNAIAYRLAADPGITFAEVPRSIVRRASSYSPSDGPYFITAAHNSPDGPATLTFNRAPAEAPVEQPAVVGDLADFRQFTTTNSTEVPDDSDEPILPPLGAQESPAGILRRAMNDYAGIDYAGAGGLNSNHDSPIADLDIPSFLQSMGVQEGGE